jgi:hypothetical protein
MGGRRRLRLTPADAKNSGPDRRPHLRRSGSRSSWRTQAEGPRRRLIYPEAASLRAHRRPVARSQPPADTPRAAYPASGTNLIYAWDGAADAGWL